MLNQESIRSILKGIKGSEHQRGKLPCTKAYICDKGNRKRNRCKDVKRNTRAFEYQIYIGKIRTFFRRAEKTEHRETCNMLLVVKTSGQKGKKFIT